MPASKVYFTDFRCRIGVSQLDKLRKLLEKSEFSQIDFDGKFVAIKLHFGELGNLSFLRANYAKVVADFIKERGGSPSSPTATRSMSAAAKTRWSIWTPRT